MAATCMSSDEFVQIYDLQLDKEFERDGRLAQWAPGTSGPRMWGEEEASITVSDDGDDEPDVNDADDADGEDLEFTTLAMAKSLDNRFLAIARNKVIKIYDAHSRNVCSELVGHSTNIMKLFFLSGRSTSEDDTTDYTVVSVADEDGGGREGSTIFWSLDSNGHQKPDTQTPALNVEDLADRAISALLETLTTEHSLDDEEVATIHGSFAAALTAADARNRVKRLPTLYGCFTGFGSYPFSHDGRRVITNSYGPRPTPSFSAQYIWARLVVYDIDSQAELFRLKGHSDNVMWASWSPDDHTIATACWDGTYTLWDASTGQCRVTIGPNGKQNWTGAFSPDGATILLSGSDNVAIYSVATGEQLAALPKPSQGRLASWIRSVSWSPRGDFIAMENHGAVLLWKPLAETSQNVLKLSPSRDAHPILDTFAQIHRVEWVDGGRKLVARCAESTLFVWDVVDNVKWRLQHPKGVPGGGGGDFVYLDDQSMVVSVDGDEKVRFWKL